jgi:hypothetical protein
MKLLKLILKIFAFSSLLMAIIVGAIAIYMRLYGDAHIKKTLSELVGSRVDFKSVAINLDKQAASFKGFSIASQVGFDKNIFDADTFTVIFNKEKLDSKKQFVFDSVYIKGAKLAIIRDGRGTLNLESPAVKTARLKEPAFSFSAVAYADEIQPKNAFYGMLKSFRSIRIEDSAITFEDHFKMAKPYKIWCNKFYADITAQDTQAGYVAATVAANLRLPQKQYGEGWAGIKASMAVYPDNTNVELSAQTGNIDLRIFGPYLQRNTPFLFNSGRFGSRTDLRMHGGAVDSLTTMYFSNLSLAVNQYDPNAQFLNVSINRLAPYLRSGENIVFDFVMKGDAKKPQFGIGPKVKYAVGMVVMEEVGKAVAAMQ